MSPMHDTLSDTQQICFPQIFTEDIMSSREHSHQVYHVDFNGIAKYEGL